ncbi:adenosylcobinamide-GDP ribazoletransferase [Saccharolobus caldissimus]|uniref:Adenosylcobinamide-GDP ribazoletransferase n=2 Tax=Saccharolobus caldissimus TaxID=1702097 RepID=A0AAQ4CWH0_9CREN|nr:adenosylcobinamide-GDP ribazoletransferase [Saccharolobus caldissimus]
MNMLKRIILTQFSFFSSIPVRVNATLEEVAAYSFLAPIIVGLPLAIIEFIIYSTLYFFLSTLAGIILLGIIELLRGFNHLDGLLDLGDALMVKGDREKRIKALKDVQIGSGGIGFLILYLAFQIVALIKLEGISSITIFNLMSSDVLSRTLSLFILGSIKPMPESTLGKVFHKSLERRLAILIIESIPFISIYNIMTYLVLYAIFYNICKSLGGSSGDITGASITLSFPLFLLVNEITHLNYSILSILCYLFSQLH